MNRYIRSVALMGSCLLGVGCEQGTAPEESSFFPEAQFVSADSVKLNTRISGLAWDPEAFFMSIAACGQVNPPTGCGIPPFLGEGNAIYKRAAVIGASVSAFDPTIRPPANMIVGTTSSTTPVGFWSVPDVPSRADSPYFITSSGAGAITATVSPPFTTPIPPTTYFPTRMMRPIRAVNGHCTSQEAVHIGKNGILEAVAKYMSVTQGRPTVVDDLADPTQFHAVVVVDAFHPGNGALRAPAANVSVEATAGQVYYISWAPPNVPPANLRSTRGFMVQDGASTAPIGIAVVVVPATSPKPPVITYSIKDGITDSVERRPWVFTAVTAPPAPGISFLGMQPRYAPGPVPLFADAPLPALCLPQ